MDRSLGRNRVPDGLRDAGWQVVTLSEHYGRPQDETVSDEAWLELAGSRGWAVLMKDERIRYRTSERQALIASGVHAFCLASGNLRAADMVEPYVSNEADILDICSHPGPSLHVITRSGMKARDLQ
jgi:hypothetical protein